jgi:hypothetical protein
MQCREWLLPFLLCQCFPVRKVRRRAATESCCDLDETTFAQPNLGLLDARVQGNSGHGLYRRVIRVVNTELLGPVVLRRSASRWPHREARRT